MTTEEAIRILNPETTAEAFEHYYGFGDKTQRAEVDEACKLAIATLRAQQERENPKPLTLDQLRQMDGEPVWLVDGSGNEMWGLVDTAHDHVDVIDGQFGLWNGVFYNMTGDGKRGLHPIGWLAYRHELEVTTK